MCLWMVIPCCGGVLQPTGHPAAAGSLHHQGKPWERPRGLVLGQPVGMGWSRNPRGAISQRQRQSCHLLLTPLRRLRTRSRAARGPPPGRGSPGPRPRHGEGRMANFTPWCQASSQHAATSSSSFGYSCERISGSKEVNGSGRRERGREKLFP